MLSKNAGLVPAVEVLHFAEAEVQKFGANNTPVFAASGPLSVFYFPTYNRYVLELNDWKFPLVRRLKISAADKNNVTERTYSLPAMNGARFDLKINNIPNISALTNFETILDTNSIFGFKGQEIAKELELSPDDRLKRNIMKPVRKISASLQAATSSNVKEAITSAIKNATDKVKTTVANLKGGQKKLANKAQKKLKLKKKDVTPRNFKKMAQSSFKKDFFTSNANLTKDFLQRRASNINMTVAKTLNELKNFDEKANPMMFLSKDYVEEIILRGKDLVVDEERRAGFYDKKRQQFAEANKAGSVGSINSIPSTTESSVSLSRVGQGPMEAHERRGKAGGMEAEPKTVDFENFTHYSG